MTKYRNCLEKSESHRKKQIGFAKNQERIEKSYERQGQPIRAEWARRQKFDLLRSTGDCKGQCPDDWKLLKYDTTNRVSHCTGKHSKTNKGNCGWQHSTFPDNSDTQHWAKTCDTRWTNKGRQCVGEIARDDVGRNLERAEREKTADKLKLTDSEGSRCGDRAREAGCLHVADFCTRSCYIFDPDNHKTERALEKLRKRREEEARKKEEEARKKKEAEERKRKEREDEIAKWRKDGEQKAYKDHNPNCDSWAQSGECSKNPGYMFGKCGLSCWAHGDDATRRKLSEDTRQKQEAYKQQKQQKQQKQEEKERQNKDLLEQLKKQQSTVKTLKDCKDETHDCNPLHCGQAWARKKCAMTCKTCCSGDIHCPVGRCNPDGNFCDTRPQCMCPDCATLKECKKNDQGILTAKCFIPDAKRCGQSHVGDHWFDQSGANKMGGGYWCGSNSACGVSCENKKLLYPGETAPCPKNEIKTATHDFYLISGSAYKKECETPASKPSNLQGWGVDSQWENPSAAPHNLIAIQVRRFVEAHATTQKQEAKFYTQSWQGTLLFWKHSGNGNYSATLTAPSGYKGTSTWSGPTQWLCPGEEAARKEAARKEAARKEAARKEAARKEDARKEAARKEAARKAEEARRKEADEAAKRAKLVCGCPDFWKLINDDGNCQCKCEDDCADNFHGNLKYNEGGCGNPSSWPKHHFENDRYHPANTWAGGCNTTWTNRAKLFVNETAPGGASASEKESEAKRRKQEEEVQRRKQEEEAQRQKQKAAEAEAQRRKQEAEAQRRKQEAEAQRRKQEAERQKREAEAERQKQEAEAQRKQAEPQCNAVGVCPDGWKLTRFDNGTSYCDCNGSGNRSTRYPNPCGCQSSFPSGSNNQGWASSCKVHWGNDIKLCVGDRAPK